MTVPEGDGKALPRCGTADRGAKCPCRREDAGKLREMMLSGSGFLTVPFSCFSNNIFKSLSTRRCGKIYPKDFKRLLGERDRINRRALDETPEGPCRVLPRRSFEAGRTTAECPQPDPGPPVHHYPRAACAISTTSGLRLRCAQMTSEVERPRMRDIPPPVVNAAFLDAVRPRLRHFSADEDARLFHGHGATCYEVFQLRYGSFPRIPDLVIWPTSHEEVEAIMRAAVRHDVGIIPFGGGTSVSNALECPKVERGMIASLDMKQMNRILDINVEDLTVTMEAGVVGSDLERALAKEGFTCGNEPDSIEFSTAGGWVATRASGMKKNVYGNIEDILVHVKMVTPQGTVQRGCKVPRMSSGPDIHQYILGSEGTLGIITEVTFKMRPKPAYQHYGSIVFPDFASGVRMVRQVARTRSAPASIRLVDNLQCQMSQALKASSKSYAQLLLDAAKRIYVTKIKGFDPANMCAATLVLEGDDPAAIKSHLHRIYGLAAQFCGLPAGAENGRRGYFLTYVIAYIRDLGFDYHYIAESFETSVPWHRVHALCENVKSRIHKSCRELKVPVRPFACCRVTQTYDQGACVYFYFGFVFRGLADPCAVFHTVEEEARREILRNGGSISHHHGVGKLRKSFMRDSVGDVGMEMMRAVKRSIDPSNILCANNCYTPNGRESSL